MSQALALFGSRRFLEAIAASSCSISGEGAASGRATGIEAERDSGCEFARSDDTAMTEGGLTGGLGGGGAEDILTSPDNGSRPDTGTGDVERAFSVDGGVGPRVNVGLTAAGCEDFGAATGSAGLTLTATGPGCFTAVGPAGEDAGSRPDAGTEAVLAVDEIVDVSTFFGDGESSGFS